MLDIAVEPWNRVSSGGMWGMDIAWTQRGMLGVDIAWTLRGMWGVDIAEVRGALASSGGTNVLGVSSVLPL